MIVLWACQALAILSDCRRVITEVRIIDATTSERARARPLPKVVMRKWGKLKNILILIPGQNDFNTLQSKVNQAENIAGCFAGVQFDSV